MSDTTTSTTYRISEFTEAPRYIISEAIKIVKPSQRARDFNTFLGDQNIIEPYEPENLKHITDALATARKQMNRSEKINVPLPTLSYGGTAPCKADNTNLDPRKYTLCIKYATFNEMDAELRKDCKDKSDPYSIHGRGPNEFPLPFDIFPLETQHLKGEKEPKNAIEHFHKEWEELEIGNKIQYFIDENDKDQPPTEQMIARLRCKSFYAFTPPCYAPHGDHNSEYSVALHMASKIQKATGTKKNKRIWPVQYQSTSDKAIEDEIGFTRIEDIDALQEIGADSFVFVGPSEVPVLLALSCMRTYPMAFLSQPIDMGEIKPPEDEPNGGQKQDEAKERDVKENPDADTVKIRELVSNFIAFRLTLPEGCFGNYILYISKRAYERIGLNSASTANILAEKVS
ncbi:hypothetical protein BS50DRAFT_588524 [Corynespora cassiicola Philippines]|uniref:Uncharacterized protein n=1 Tax=Corynespora cassiicola Philippines TaxID=1448308 RepID=A0A2T2NKC7_CORCC|nr:hypothetical protein BS50DRAFT_588524 [Corynespora cassiicola Philippines]